MPRYSTHPLMEKLFLGGPLPFSVIQHYGLTGHPAVSLTIQD